MSPAKPLTPDTITSLGIPLADETWTQATHAEVALAFLRSEWDKVPHITGKHDRRLIDAPNLADAVENNLRRLILESWRKHLLDRIPADTVWWRVQHLRDTHASALLVIGSPEWLAPTDRNELLNVARRRGETLRTQPSDWDPPILWGHDRDGPFTIIEGNNRLVNQMATAAMSPFAVECFVGQSPTPWQWHLPDRKLWLQLIDGKTSDEIEAALPPHESTKRVAAKFSEIWRSSTWKCAETRSGPGSTLAQTEVVRNELLKLFDELGVRVLVDAGCGELNWMSKINEKLDLYLGFDVVEDLVADLRKRFEARKTLFFNTADITHHALPRADAILCRDVMTHLPHAMVMRALENFRKSGTRYLIATTFPRGRNDPIRLGAWQAMDLCAEPFLLPPPQRLISEALQNSRKSLGVWCLNETRQLV